VQCYVGFFSHAETDTIDFKIRAIFFFQMGCIPRGLPRVDIVTC
jgi:hypothetical protein